MVKRLMVWIAVMSIIPPMFSGFTGISSPQNRSAHIQEHQPVSSPQSPQITTIEFGGQLGFNYSPKDVRIAPGDSVKWQGDFTMHPLVSDENLWPTVNTGTEFTFTFTQPGIYHFHCFFHGSIGMNGTVTVGFYDFLPIVK